MQMNHVKGRYCGVSAKLPLAIVRIQILTIRLLNNADAHIGHSNVWHHSKPAIHFYVFRYVLDFPTPWNTLISIYFELLRSLETNAQRKHSQSIIPMNANKPHR